MIARLHPFAWMLVVSFAVAGCSGSTDASPGSEVDSGATSPVDGGGTDAGSDAAKIDSATAGDSGIAVDSTTTADADADAIAADVGPGGLDFTAAGPHPVAKKDTTVAGNTVHCVYPTDAPPAAGWSGVAFAHGFQLKTTNYDAILSHLASWGFVVVSTDYPGSLFSVDHRDVATALTAVRTALAASSIAGLPKVDATRIAAAGHSLGGKGAVMAVLADASFVAALTFDPVDGNPGNPFGGGPDAAHPQLTPTQTASLKVPMGYFGATQSHCGSTPCAPTTLDAAAFASGTPASTPHHLWTVWDFGHMQFLDDPACGFTCSACAAGKSPIDPRKTAIEATSVAFLRRYVEGDLAAQTWLDGPKRDAFVAAKDYWDGTSTAPACP